MDFTKLIVLYNALSSRQLTQQEKLDLTKFVCALFKIDFSDSMKDNIRAIEKYFGVNDE